MRRVFSWYAMVPAILVFSLCNGLYLHSVPADLLFICTAFFGGGAAIIALLYGSFIQGGGILFRKGALWVGLIVYVFFLILSVDLLMSTYQREVAWFDQTAENIRYLSLNLLVTFGYGGLGIIWSFLTRKFYGLLRRLPTPPMQTDTIGIEE